MPDSVKSQIGCPQEGSKLERVSDRKSREDLLHWLEPKKKSGEPEEDPNLQLGDSPKTIEIDCGGLLRH
jgi:hypothetical protein